MRDNFDRSLDVTLAYEGGYVNHPKDPGGHTNKGVTLATLRRYVPNANVADLKSISKDLLRRIYRNGYWDEVSGDRLAAGVDLAAFDYGVNSGPGAANKSLMAVVGGTDVETVKKLCARRLAIYRTFSHWSTFGTGWTRRIAAVEAKAVAWALAAIPHVSSEEVRVTLEKNSDAAGTQAKRDAQTSGGAVVGTGAGGAAAVPINGAPIGQATDTTTAWIIFAAVAAIGAAAAVIWARRAWINRLRADAYAAEAFATGEA